MASYSPLRKSEDISYDPAKWFGDLELEPLALPKARVPSIASAKTCINWTENDEHPLLAPSKPPIQSGIPHSEKTLRASSVVSRQKRRKLQGWHFGVNAAMWMTATVLLVNLIFTIVGVAKYHPDDGIGTALIGSCDHVNNVATWIHILINALSSLLLSASNYTMQCLYAPTRADVDRAHRGGKWLDIGVPGVRNLFKIAPLRSLLWLVLALSSVPIHLLYNSAIFKSLDANTYNVLVATQSFLDPSSSANLTGVDSILYSTAISRYNSNEFDDEYYMDEIVKSFHERFTKDNAWQNKSNFEILNNKECIKEYNNMYTTGRDHVIAVTQDQATEHNNTVSLVTGSVPEIGITNWWCLTGSPNSGYSNYYYPSLCRGHLEPSNWTIVEKKISHCISHIQPPHCKLQFSVQILITVMLCNAAKLIAMWLTFLKQKEATLVTVGDAVASFLSDPDKTTEGRCLMNKADTSSGLLGWVRRDERRSCTNPQPTVYVAQSGRHWRNAVSTIRWTITIGLGVIVLVVASFLLSSGIINTNNSGISAFSLGFGAVDPRSMASVELLKGGSGLVASVLLANLPQGILSVLYLMYNSLYTFMCLATEWSKFADKRKPLRVTTPHGQQRSTYYLQLPYWYGIPLILASATLHWLISQSIFLARVDVYEDGVMVPGHQVSRVGYSNAPTLCIIVIGLVMLFIAIGMGFRKLDSNMPVASSCSLAIAAACHRPSEDVDAAYLPVKWGEVTTNNSDEVGHCCITSYDVQRLVVGKQYAGARGSAGVKQAL